MKKTSFYTITMLSLNIFIVSVLVVWISTSILPDVYSFWTDNQHTRDVENTGNQP